MKKLFLLIGFLLMNISAYAELNIDITGGKNEPIPIAISDFTGIPRAQEIQDVLKNDLESSGLFRVINSAAYIQNMESVEQTPDFENWQVINGHALIVADANVTPDGQIQLNFRLWDIFERQSKLKSTIKLPSNEWRRLAHIAADKIYEQMTGDSGYFDSRIVYVSETGSFSKKVKRLAMMDQDGANHYYLTDGKTLVLTPRFAPSVQKIAYLSFDKGKPRIFIMDITTGITEDLGHFDGMNFAPNFSPDGKKLLLSQVIKGNSEIFLYDLNTKKKSRLTNNMAIDTSPSFSPDGKRIVFNLDRASSQQLYVMDADGSNVKRISFGSKGSYATPVWSPRGDYIAFTKIQNNTFYIGVMHPDGSGERLITEGFLVEGPTWSPNGRVLAFFKQQGPNNEAGIAGPTGLYSIDITGYNERYIPTPQDASDPAWSPLLSKKKM